MKSHLQTLVLALLAGFAGGLGSQLFQLGPTPSEREDVDRTTDVPNPFQIKAESSDVALPLAQMQQKISRLETQLNQLAQARAAISSNPGAGSDFPDERPTPQQAPLASDEDYLAAVGVNPDVASDILRRISQQQFRSLELRNLMRTQDPSDRQQHADELSELDANRISLRSELGDEKYDEYLAVSGRNNRVRVRSVMAGSPAEANGVQPGDVILYYDDHKILGGNDLRRAALAGATGDFANVEVLRDDDRITLTVPYGTLGVEMEEIQIDPAR